MKVEIDNLFASLLVLGIIMLDLAIWLSELTIPQKFGLQGIMFIAMAVTLALPGRKEIRMRLRRPRWWFLIMWLWLWWLLYITIRA